MKKSIGELEMDECSTTTGYPKQEDKYVLLCTVISTKNTSALPCCSHSNLVNSYLSGFTCPNAQDSLELSLLHEDEKINLIKCVNRE